MMHKALAKDEPAKGKARATWGAVLAGLLVVSTLAFSVPTAFAEPQDAKSAEMLRYFQEFESVYQFILQNYVDEVEPKKLYEGAMKGMLDSLGDPYSVYLDEAMLSDMTDTTEGVFGGIGLYIGKQAPNPRSPDAPRYIEIISPIEDTPGWRAGFMPGDLIVAINGEDSSPLMTDEAQARLRGTPGTEVKVRVRRGSAEFDITVTRAVIEVPTLKSALIPHKGGNVAYLRIIEFTPKTLPRIQDALRGFDKTGYSSMIVDVRSNPGGLLDSVVKIADLFLSSGVIVSTKGRNPYENSVRSAKPDLAVPADKPVIVLINRGSASASEILAGALKDRKRALIVGENSYGKGSVQQVFPLGNRGIKLTMARYYAPSDENIDKTGIPPDIPAKEAELSEAESAALVKLLESGAIADFAKAKPDATKAERDDFVRRLRAEGSILSERLLGRLLRDELQRTRVAPVYDLEYDAALTAALEVLTDGSYSRRLAEARTVKELVAEKKAAEAAKK